MNEFINPYLVFHELFYIHERRQLIQRKKEVEKIFDLVQEKYLG
jgi:hypothetical protein